MIDISDDEIVVQKATRTGRFLLFCDTELPRESVIPWWSVMMDIGGDGAAILVRLDENHGHQGFTALSLIRIAIAATAAHNVLRRSVLADESLRQLGDAQKAETRRRLGMGEAGRVAFDFGPPEGYPWMRAECEDDAIDLCPDPAGLDGGATIEQVIMVLDQLYADAIKAYPADANLALAAAYVGRALQLEAERAAYHLGRR